MQEITYQNMSEKLVELLPELRKKYEEECEWWEDEVPGSHIIYGDVLDPYLISLLELNEPRLPEQEATLRCIFTFLENYLTMIMGMCKELS